MLVTLFIPWNCIEGQWRLSAYALVCSLSLVGYVLPVLNQSYLLDYLVMLLRSVPIAIAEAFENAAESSKLLWIYAGDKKHVDLVTWQDSTLLHELLHGTYVQLVCSASSTLLRGVLS